MLCLPNSEIDAAVLAEAGPHLGPGAIVVDTTTGEPEQMEALGRGLRERGVEYLDATVGGSSQQVRASQTIVMAGGDAEAFARCRDLFACFAPQAFHLGPCGSGARMKLVVNLVLGLSRAALAAGLAFAAACGAVKGPEPQIARIHADLNRSVGANAQAGELRHAGKDSVTGEEQGIQVQRALRNMGVWDG